MLNYFVKFCHARLTAHRLISFCSNAAAGIYVAGRAGSLQQGLAMARESLLSGKAFEKLELLVKHSNPLSVTRGR